jgi:predicted phosphodiesterase
MAEEAIAVAGEGVQARPAMRKMRMVAARTAFLVLFITVCLAGVVISVSLLGRSLYAWHGFEVELRLLPASVGETRLVLTPLGEVKARTHRAPVALIASLQAINSDEIQKLLKSNPKRNALAHDFERTARADLRNFVIRQIGMAGLGALLAPLLLSPKRLWTYAISIVLGMAFLGITLESALSTFNGKAFEAPTYTGTLKEAPWVIQFGKDAFNKVEALSQKLITVANNLNVLYGRIAALPDQLAGEDATNTIRVLHVSDLHNNTAALDFIREVADQFHVDFIVDTGDLTDFGSPPETVMVRGIAKLPYPYVFVLGNHDSQAVASALAKTHNVTILNGQVIEVKGLTLLGLPNPASVRAGVGSVDTTPAELQAGGAELLQLVNNLPAPPDIIAIHDPAESQPLWGRVPLILCGHEHRLYIQYQTGPNPDSLPVLSAGAAVLVPGAATPTGVRAAYTTVLCNAGTTGAAGLRYFEKEKGVPFSCAVLTFDRPASPASLPPTHAPTAPASTPPAPSMPAPRPRLRAIDQISLDGTMQEYAISHHVFNAPGTPLPTPSPLAATPTPSSPAAPVPH